MGCAPSNNELIGEDWEARLVRISRIQWNCPKMEAKGNKESMDTRGFYMEALVRPGSANNTYMY